MPINKTVWEINGVAYVPPLVPTLVKILDGASANADFNETENTFVFPANKVIQVTFPPEYVLFPFHLYSLAQLRSHTALTMSCTVCSFFPPYVSNLSHLSAFHLHGNNFWVVKSNDSDVINTINPIRRDVNSQSQRH